MTSTFRRPLRRLLRPALATLLAVWLAPAARAAVWTLGHGDIGVVYDPVDPQAFELEAHVKQNGVVDGQSITDPAGSAFEPGDLTIRLPQSANLRRIDNPTAFWTGLPGTGYNFTGSAYDALGVPAGADLWVLSPTGADADHYATPFLGWSTEEGFGGDNFGNVTFTPTSFSGPSGGTMAVYDGSTQFWVLQAGDTTFTSDSFSVPAGAHAHRTVFFTRPGSYQIGIRAAGLNGATQVSGQAIYNFQVVPEPSGGSIAVAAGALAAATLRRARFRTARGRKLVRTSRRNRAGRIFGP